MFIFAARNFIQDNYGMKTSARVDLRCQFFDT